MEIQGFEGVPDGTFRRLTGVRKRTFSEMAVVLGNAEAFHNARGGQPNHLAVETRLLMTLEYWREYRTYLHIGHSDGMSDRTAYRNIRWCEDARITRGALPLPGKQALVKRDMHDKSVLIDATETPVARPPNNNAVTTRDRTNATH